MAKTSLLRSGMLLPVVGLVVLSGGFCGLVAQTFDDFTEVIEVQVPVNVVTKSGVPIRGLTAENFQVLDGKIEQEITNFRVVDLDTVTFSDSSNRASWVEGDQNLPPSRSEVERAIPSEARRHFLLLFDMSFSKPGCDPQGSRSGPRGCAQLAASY